MFRLLSSLPSTSRPLSSLLPVIDRAYYILLKVFQSPLLSVKQVYIPQCLFCFGSVIFLLDVIFQILDLEKQY